MMYITGVIFWAVVLIFLILVCYGYLEKKYYALKLKRKIIKQAKKDEEEEDEESI